MKLEKPLGHRSYGSIPHLKGSRFGESDRGITAGQEKILTRQARDSHDIVIVTEKLDGSNVSVYKDETGQLIPLTRSGYRCVDSKYEQHRLFHRWVKDIYCNHEMFSNLLFCGERLCGEWLAQAHGIKYDLQNKHCFAPFDIMTGHDREPYLNFRDRVAWHGFDLPKLISYGPPVSIKWVQTRLKESDHNSIEKPEGAVWRVERKGKVDFLAKWVRWDMVCGKYFPENNNGEEVWNWHPTKKIH